MKFLFFCFSFFKYSKFVLDNFTFHRVSCLLRLYLNALHFLRFGQLVVVLLLFFWTLYVFLYYNCIYCLNYFHYFIKQRKIFSRTKCQRIVFIPEYFGQQHQVSLFFGSFLFLNIRIDFSPLITFFVFHTIFHFICVLVQKSSFYFFFFPFS